MIPIFRAKKLDSDEYVEGFLTRSRCYSGIYILPSNYNQNENIEGYEDEISEIDITTISIHFPDMLDSQRNKIFASLQEDGKGGDILGFSSNYFGDYTTVLYFKNHRLITHSKTIKENTIRNKESLSSSKVIGIQQ